MAKGKVHEIMQVAAITRLPRRICSVQERSDESVMDSDKIMGIVNPQAIPVVIYQARASDRTAKQLYLPTACQDTHNIWKPWSDTLISLHSSVVVSSSSGTRPVPARN